MAGTSVTCGTQNGIRARWLTTSPICPAQTFSALLPPRPRLFSGLAVEIRVLGGGKTGLQLTPPRTSEGDGAIAFGLRLRRRELAESGR